MTSVQVDPELGEKKGYFLVVAPEPASGSTISLRSTLATLWYSRWLIIACGVVAGALALASAFVRAPVYRAEAVVTVRANDLAAGLGLASGQVGNLAALVGLDLGERQSNRNEYLAVLKSSALARDFVQRHDVMPALYKDRWNAETRTVEPNWRGRVPTLGDTVESFEKLRRIREDGRTGIVTVTFEADDPERAARWANAYVDAANNLLREEAGRRARTAITYLNDALERTSEEPIRQALYRLLEGRLNEAMLASVEPEFAFKVVERAVPADPHRFVRPRRVPETILGLFFGLIAGCAVALLRDRRNRAR